MSKIIVAALMLLAGTLSALAQGAVPADVLRDLAPTGKLRAALNFGNSVLAKRDAAGGPPKGVSADLARELARRLGVPIELIAFDAAGKVFEAGKAGQWDIAFFAIEPVRAAEVTFTSPYVLIEGTYMVLKDSPLKAIADVDKPGIKIAVGRGSAYDLFLTRTIKQATIVRAVTGGGLASIELFLNEKLDAAAGVKQPLVEHAKTNPNVRVMDGNFMVIRQAMGTPKDRGEAGVKYLRAFVEEMKASGFVAAALTRSHQPDAQVAPAGD